MTVDPTPVPEHLAGARRVLRCAEEVLALADGVYADTLALRPTEPATGPMDSGLVDWSVVERKRGITLDVFTHGDFSPFTGVPGRRTITAIARTVVLVGLLDVTDRRRSSLTAVSPEARGALPRWTACPNPQFPDTLMAPSPPVVCVRRGEDDYYLQPAAGAVSWWAMGGAYAASGDPRFRSMLPMRCALALHDYTEVTNPALAAALR